MLPIFQYDFVSFAASYSYYAAVFSLLIVIGAYDFRHKIIPDSMTLVLGALGLFGVFFMRSTGLDFSLPSVLELFAPVFVAGPFAAVWYMSRGKWMGLGDAKLLVGLTWFLGLGRMLSAVVLAFWVGAAVGLFLIIFSKKHGLKSEIPFGPFLIFGAFLVFLAGVSIFPAF